MGCGVSTAYPSFEPRVAGIARSRASTMRPPSPAGAVTETLFGVDMKRIRESPTERHDTCPSVGKSLSNPAITADSTHFGSGEPQPFAERRARRLNARAACRVAPVKAGGRRIAQLGHIACAGRPAHQPGDAGVILQRLEQAPGAQTPQGPGRALGRRRERGGLHGFRPVDRHRVDAGEGLRPEQTRNGAEHRARLSTASVSNSTTRVSAPSANMRASASGVRLSRTAARSSPTGPASSAKIAGEHRASAIRHHQARLVAVLAKQHHDEHAQAPPDERRDRIEPGVRPGGVGDVEQHRTRGAAPSGSSMPP